MSETKKYSGLRFGKAGAPLPLLTMILTIIGMSIAGMRGTQNMQVACFLAIVMGWIVIKDPKQFKDAVTNGVRSPVVAQIVPIILMACILGKFIAASHMGDAMMYWILEFNISPAFIPLFIFLVSGLIAFASGSSAAAATAVRLVMCPMAYALGCNMGLCAAAVVAGGQFGDNLAPISDSVVVSATTQEVEVNRVFRYRLKYSLLCFAVSAVLYLVFGYKNAPDVSAMAAATDAQYAFCIIYLIIPVVTLTIMLKTGSFFNAMLSSQILCALMLLGFGQISFRDIFTVEGPIASGIASGVNSIIFLILIFIVTSISETTGCVRMIRDGMTKLAHGSIKGQEAAAGGYACFGALVTGSPTMGIGFSGPVVREIIKSTRIDRARTASITGAMSAGCGCIVPWGVFLVQTPAILLSIDAAPAGFSGLDMIPYMFYCFALLVVYWFLIITGFDRRIETEEELAADGVKL